MKKDFELYGIIGNPLGHTLSPVMQETAFSKLGKKAFYLTLELDLKSFNRFRKNLKTLPLQGFNVTVPYKEKMLTAVEKLSGEAKSIGAVNTVFLKQGKIWGANTDAFGFAQSLKKDANFKPKGKEVLVFGAGGSARAVLYGLGELGVKRVVIVNRTLSRARSLAKKFNFLFKKSQYAAEKFSKDKLKDYVSQADLVINTTSLGLKTRDKALLRITDLPKAGRRDGKLFYDLIYKPAETPFLKMAKKRGHQICNGASMLAYQGAKSFEYWTGRRAPTDLMIKTLMEELK